MNVFNDIKVLELGRVFSGPLCGMLLADLGAKVLKVERPGVGDESRRFGAHRAGGNSCYFNSLNRNKKSIALNLKDEDDRTLFEELIRKADVLVHNWLQVSLDKLGFSYEEVKKLNPRIIYCSISGYGSNTSFAHKPAQDIIAQALSGFMSLTGHPGGPPLKTGIPVVDYVTGLYAAFSIMSALHMRQLTSEGQLVTTSLLESALAMTSFSSSAHLSTEVLPGRTGNRHPAICPYSLYRTSDGYVVIAVANDEMWNRFCAALELEAIAGDERFCTNARRLGNQEMLEELLDAHIFRLTTVEALERFKKAKVSCAPVHDLRQAFACPPVAELDMQVQCGDNGDVRFVGTPFHLEKVPTPKTASPPPLSQDEEDVRARRDW